MTANIARRTGELALYPYQAAIVSAMRFAIARGHKHIVAGLATGAGKTIIAREIARAAHAKGNHVFFVVDRIVLVHQTVEKFAAVDLRCAVLQGENTVLDPHADVTVCTIQTLRGYAFDEAKSQHIGEPGVVFFDEAHIVFKAHRELLDHWPDAIFIGLSATPIRQGMGELYSELIRGPSVRQLMSDGYLVGRAKYYVPNTPDLTGAARVVTQFGTDYAMKDLEVAMRVLVGDVVACWRRIAENRRTIVFAVNIAHARELVAAFENEGIRAGMVYQRTTSEERGAYYAALRDGSLRILISVNVLALGFDEPSVGCVVFARPTMSKALYVQQGGRGLRSHAGKNDCVFIDHAGNVERHGRLEDFEFPDLDDEELTRNSSTRTLDPESKPCTECGFLLEPGQWECPQCNHANRRDSKVEVVAGDLVELDTVAAVNAVMSPKQFLRELLWKHAHDPRWHNRKRLAPACADYAKFRNLTPSRPEPGWWDLDPEPPSTQCENELKRQWIAYRKRHDRKEAEAIVPRLPQWLLSQERAPCSKCSPADVRVYSGTGPHLAQERCAACGKHRGWVSAQKLISLAKKGEF